MSIGDENVYKAPSSNIVPEQSTTPSGEIDLSRVDEKRFTVSFGEVWSEGWSLVKGTKLTYFLSYLIYLALAYTPFIIYMIVAGVSFESAASTGLYNAISTALSLVLMPLSSGIMMLGLHRAMQKEISVKMIFQYYPKIVGLIGISLVIGLMTVVGMILLVIPGIFLAVALSMVMYLYLSGVGFGKSIKYSIKGVKQFWFTMFFLFLALGLINLLTVFTLFIGLIWTVPFSLNVIGVVFRKVYIAE